jgi:lysylphosphatidylglycerol synthetase-like protein (DUF2156 family)
VGTLSAQVFALVFILIPGSIAFLSFALSNGRTKLNMQRGLLMDTALFVLAATVLHITVGLVIMYTAEAVTYCRVVYSLAELVSTRVVFAARHKVCSLDADLAIVLCHLLVISFAAWIVGKWASRWVAGRKGVFMALNGPYYDWTPPGEAPIIIADVLTDIEHDGKYLMYEGKLEEIGLSASKTIEYVCLVSPQRFLLELNSTASKTTERAKFVAIDREGRGTSRIVIKGDQIKNFLTRTHLIEKVEIDEETSQDPSDPYPARRQFIMPEWLLRVCDAFRRQ